MNHKHGSPLKEGSMEIDEIIFKDFKSDERLKVLDALDIIKENNKISVKDWYQEFSMLYPESNVKEFLKKIIKSFSGYIKRTDEKEYSWKDNTDETFSLRYKKAMKSKHLLVVQIMGFIQNKHTFTLDMLTKHIKKTYDFTEPESEYFAKYIISQFKGGLILPGHHEDEYFYAKPPIMHDSIDLLKNIAENPTKDLDWSRKKI